jgi:hypothetical protein
VVKFLRRSPAGEHSLIIEEFGPDFFDSLKARGVEEVDDDVLVEAILKKFEILQTREKKIKLLKNLAPLSESWVWRVFLDLLGDSSEDIRDMASRELSCREDCPLERLTERLRQPPWYVKSAILRVLSAKKDRHAVAAIREVTGDPNVDVRRAAAIALGEIGGPEARALLVRLFKDKNSVVRTAAAEALDKIVELKFL